MDRRKHTETFFRALSQALEDMHPGSVIVQTGLTIDGQSNSSQLHFAKDDPTVEGNRVMHITLVHYDGSYRSDSSELNVTQSIAKQRITGQWGWTYHQSDLRPRGDNMLIEAVSNYGQVDKEQLKARIEAHRATPQPAVSNLVPLPSPEA